MRQREVPCRRKCACVASLPDPCSPVSRSSKSQNRLGVDQFKPTPELERYVVRNRIPQVHGRKNVWAAWIDLRPLSPNFWLQGARTRKNRCALRVHMQ